MGLLLSYYRLGSQPCRTPSGDPWEETLPVEVKRDTCTAVSACKETKHWAEQQRSGMTETCRLVIIWQGRSSSCAIDLVFDISRSPHHGPLLYQNKGYIFKEEYLYSSYLSWNFRSYVLSTPGPLPLVRYPCRIVLFERDLSYPASW